MRKAIIFILLTQVVLISCERKSEYRRVIESELAKNTRYDSLFLGLKFGMTSKQFFDTCWIMNQKGILKEGPDNTQAQYFIDSTDILGPPVYMRFYPEFKDGIVYKMPVNFTYKAWAPWNKNFSADSLLPKVVRLMEEWYGPELIKMDGKDSGLPIWYKVDGNRHMVIYKRDTSNVTVEFLDLLIENPLELTDSHSQKQQ